MWCENWNIDNQECKKEIQIPTNSANDFTEFVNKWRRINEEEKKDPNILPKEADFDKAFNFTQQVNWPIWDYNTNAKKKVELPHQENNNYGNKNSNCIKDWDNISCQTIWGQR